MKEKPRKFLRLPWVVLGLGLVIGVYFLLQDKIVDSQLRPIVERELAKAVHSPVSIQSIRGGLLGDVVLNHVVLTVPGSPWESRLAVDQISINLELFNLIFHRKPLEECFKSVSFYRPQISLVRNDASSDPSKPVSESPALDITKIPLPVIPAGKLFIRQGSFSIQAGKTPREIVNNVNFQASTENGKIWGLLLQAHSPEAGSQGTIAFNGSFSLEKFKILGKLNLQQWPLASGSSVLKDLSGWELEGGTIDAESPFVFQPGHLWFDAKTTLWKASVKSPEPVGIVFSDINGRAFIRPTELTVPGDIHFNVGQTPWTASGVLPFDSRPLAVRTSTDQLSLAGVFADILKIKDLKADGTGSAAFAVAGVLSDPILEGTAKLGPSHVGNWQLDSFSVKAGYEKERFNLYDVEGKLYDGQLQANGFIALSGEGNAPVSLSAVLTDVEAKKLASTLGVSGMDGRGNVELHLGGSINEPIVSATSQMNLTRLVQDNLLHYTIKSSLQLKNQKLELSATINDKARLEGELLEKGDHWEVEKFVLVAGKKTVKLTGTGNWPKTDDQPIDIQIIGKNIPLQDLPFLNDQFSDITGLVDLDLNLAGTRKSPSATVQFFSNGIVLGDLDPDGKKVSLPLNVSLAWKPGELDFEKFEVGDIFSTSGKLGLDPDSSLDLKIQAQGVPIKIISEIGIWNNPPQPFEGWVTGHLHFEGFRKNPIIEGEGSVDSLKVGDWEADQVEALLNMEQGKLQIKKVKLNQGTNSILITGSWDTRSDPGKMSLHFSSHDFQLGKGPFLSGDFQWDAETGDPFWKNWKGAFSTEAFSLTDLNKKTYQFSKFSMNASCDDSVLRGKFNLGKTIYGSGILDASGNVVEVQALLRIEPILLSDAPNLTQFLPSSLKVKGSITGQLQLKKGTLAELPMEGSFVVTDGAIQNYDFDRTEFKFAGDKSKITGSLSLVRDEAKYTLAGSLSSPRAFWDEESQVTVDGPFKNEKLVNLLALMGVDTPKHKVSGQVDGNLSVSGALGHPSVGFLVTGQNLRFDNNIAPSAELHFSEVDGKIILEKNQINLAKGQININQGNIFMDPEDPTVAVMDISGSTKDLPIAIFNLTSQIHLSGRLALDEKESRPTFEGLLSLVDTGHDAKNVTPFDLAMSVHKKVIEFKPLDSEKTQLVGVLDISQEQKIIFKDIHLEHSTGSFSVDGTLDLNGSSKFVSDAKDIPIEEVGKWFLPNFPLSGTGSYHMVFEGGLDNPLFTTSITVSGGKIGELQFDLLNGELKSRDNLLYLGTKEAPLQLSRSGLFNFTVDGKVPLALTKESWAKVRNHEMDINAQMDKGDFGIILLAGFADKASGNMNFSAHVGGTLDNPVVTMDLDLKQCQLAPQMVAQSLSDINGRIKIRDNKLAVEDLNFRVGQGRVFITSPPIEESKMILQDFIPQYLDFRVRTVGDHGLWLSIPTIMKKGEWGEIYFYGATPKDPLLIRGPLAQPQVIGTALLDTGHYTFPPDEAVDRNGAKIEFRELAGVTFQLKLVSGKNCWYKNDFNTNYMELKVDPGDEITITGKDIDRTPEEAGIKCNGTAGSKEGWLRYLGHEFKLEEATLYIPKGKLPTMWGRATDHLQNVQIVSAGGVRTTDMDIWLDFKGTFGNIDLKLDSSPHFSTNDPDIQQKLLLSYIIFGRDMTGYTTSQLQTIYQQNYGQAAGDALLQTFDRISSSVLTSPVRQFLQNNAGIDLSIKSNLASNLVSAVPTAGVSQLAVGNNSVAAGNDVPLVQADLVKPLDPRLTFKGTVGALRNQSTDGTQFQTNAGLEYRFSKNWSLNVNSGINDYGQGETSAKLLLSQSLPDIMSAKKGDTTLPRFVRFDIYSIGLGKFQLNWETDKVTLGEVKVSDDKGEVAQDVSEKGQHAYDHQLVVDKLNPDMEYQVEITVRDLNDNKATKAEKISPSTE